MPILIGKPSRAYPLLRESYLIETAIEDVLISYFGRPEQFDPNRLGFGTYLHML